MSHACSVTRLASAFLLLGHVLASCGPASDKSDDDPGGIDPNGDDDDDDDDDDNDADDGDETPPASRCDELPLTTLRAAKNPPCGLKAQDVPLFVALGFDDNAYSGLAGSAGDGGVSWVVDMLSSRTNPKGSGQAETFDGTRALATFYFTSTYIGTWISESPTLVKRSWHQAKQAGHEVGNHTHSHNHGAAFDQSAWAQEIDTCLEWLQKPFDSAEGDQEPKESAGIGAALDEVYGFRTPFLEYNDAMLQTVADRSFVYDCSIEEGWQDDQDGQDYYWPYTLDWGSPGNEVLVDWELKEAIEPQPGLWEMPVYAYIVPPDDACERYGIEPGLRAKLKTKQDWFDEASGKITGFDYNLWVSMALTKAEFVATLKYTFDQRLTGNRAPFLVGVHSDYYSDKYTAAPNASPQERREALVEFVDYVLSHDEARVVRVIDVLDWLREPVALQGG